MTATYELQPDGTLREVADPPTRADLVQVVRCRDCKWSRIHDGKSYPGNRHEEYVGKMYCIAWGDGMQGEWTNPNGYCHRGKRRSDDRYR